MLFPTRREEETMLRLLSRLCLIAAFILFFISNLISPKRRSDEDETPLFI